MDGKLGEKRGQEGKGGRLLGLRLRRARMVERAKLAAGLSVAFFTLSGGVAHAGKRMSLRASWPSS